MSIVDALKKAKALGEIRQRENAHRAGGMERDADVSSAPVDDRTLVPEYRNDALAQAPSSPLVRPSFRELQFSSETCMQNRILAPDADRKLAQHASPAYRMLRTRLLQRCRANNWSSIAITSPGPGEGKSLTALNLALTIARERNNEVFLMDLDMRNPSMCKYLGITPQVEVVDYFQGKANAADLFFSVGIECLNLAGSSSTAANASELLSTTRLSDLLTYIKSVSANPLVLLDLPPVVNTDDALVVAPSVDAVLLIVGEGRTNREELQRAFGLLSEYTVAGIVLNRALESMGSDYYGAT